MQTAKKDVSGDKRDEPGGFDNGGDLALDPLEIAQLSIPELKKELKSRGLLVWPSPCTVSKFLVRSLREDVFIGWYSHADPNWCLRTVTGVLV